MSRTICCHYWKLAQLQLGFLHWCWFIQQCVHSVCLLPPWHTTHMHAHTHLLTHSQLFAHIAIQMKMELNTKASISEKCCNVLKKHLDLLASGRACCLWILYENSFISSYVSLCVDIAPKTSSWERFYLLYVVNVFWCFNRLILTDNNLLIVDSTPRHLDLELICLFQTRFVLCCLKIWHKFVLKHDNTSSLVKSFHWKHMFCCVLHLDHC